MENQYKHETTKFLVSTIAQIIALTVMIITAAAPFVLYQQQQSLALEQQQQQQQPQQQNQVGLSQVIKQIAQQVANANPGTSLPLVFYHNR